MTPSCSKASARSISSAAAAPAPNPLIQILHSRGYAITGSDVEETKNTEAERALGVRVCIGHDAANVGNADLVVYSAAIHDDNPELQAARARGIKAVERSVMLGYISRTHAQSIGVAGTHGKTTTTGMITTMLELAGRTRRRSSAASCPDRRLRQGRQRPERCHRSL